MAKAPQAQLVADVCADCGSPGAGWASLNRGVLMCDECCSLHRSLGRHVSQVVSLRKGNMMTPSRQQMLIQLINGGANLIWEYALLDPANNGAWQKPTPKDALSKKETFIREKYVVHAFCQRPTDPNVTRDDLSKQLHASVRTNNIETSLRLLALGADVNYVHPDRGTSPLHVAVQANRLLQVELLLVYGADALARDSNGKTPLDLAREIARAAAASSNANAGANASANSNPNGTASGSASILPFSEMELRLLDSVFEITDRLTIFLSGRKPDHSRQIIVVPEISPDKVDMSEFAMEARSKLQSLPDRLFEELLIDAFDEADRREVEVCWTALTTPTFRKGCPPIVFLPVCHAYSATRNQARQKLGRLSEREWNTLVLDCIREARARFRASDWRVEMVRRAEQSLDGDLERIPSNNDSPVDDVPSSSLSAAQFSSEERRSRVNEQLEPVDQLGDQLQDEDHFYHDHEPVYDQVPVELDYVKVTDEIFQPHADKAGEGGAKRKDAVFETSLDSPIDMPIAAPDQIEPGDAIGELANCDGMVMINADQYLALKRSFEASEARIHELVSENKQLQYEVDSLQHNMLQLVEENAALRNALQQLSVANEATSNSNGSLARKSSLPASAIAQMSASPSLTLASQIADSTVNKESSGRENRETFLLNTSNDGSSQTSSSDTNTVSKGDVPAMLTVSTSSSSQLAVAAQSGTPLSSPSNATAPAVANGVLAASGGDSVARYTDALAKLLRDLVKAVNDGSSARYAILCNAVDVNVKEMCAAFLSALNEDALDDARLREVQQCINALQDGARDLKESATNIVQQRRASFTVSATSGSSGQPDANAINADWANQVKAHFLIYTMGKALRSFIACLNK